MARRKTLAVVYRGGVRLDKWFEDRSIEFSELKVEV